MRIGSCELSFVSDGEFRLDGGAMFGIIPQPLWTKRAPPDDAGRIEMALRCLLLRVDDRIILVDTGMGDKWNEKEAARFGLDQSSRSMARALAAEGLTADDITDVLLTHLHFDHAGGATRLNEDGKLVLSYPKAKYWVQRRNWQHAQNPTARDQGSYRKENFAPLINSDQLVLLDGPSEIAPGVDTIIFEGHTVGQQLVRVRDQESGQWLLYCADIIPSSAHLHAPWVMGYDLMPDVTAREKARIVGRAVDEGGWLAFEHDPKVAACKVRLDEKGRPEAYELVTDR